MAEPASRRRASLAEYISDEPQTQNMIQVYGILVVLVGFLIVIFNTLILNPVNRI